MKRHDTHLLSDESEKGEKEEDAHEYIFNSSKNSSKNSEEQYITKQSNKKNILYKNILNQKNIRNNSNASIISSKDIDGIFGNYNNNRDRNNLPKTEKKIINKIYIKFRNKYNNNSIVNNYLTYNPPIKKNIFDKKYKNHNYRKCISLTDYNQNKNNNKIDRSKLKRFKKFDPIKDKEMLYFFYDDNILSNKHFLNIINQHKSKLLQITNDNFSIKSKPRLNLKKNFPLFNDYEKGINIRKNNYSYKISYFSSKKIQNDYKNNLFINKYNNLLLNYNNSFINNNFAIKNTFRKSPKKKLSLKLKKKYNKIEMMYELYIGEQNNINKKFAKLNSIETFLGNIENRMKIKKYQKYKKYLDNRIHKNKKNIIKTLFQIRTKDNFKNLNNFSNYSKHFGNNDSCPLCKSIEHKNEESILNMGIHPMTPNLGNENWSNSWKNRRVYSALSRFPKKNNKNNSELFEMNDTKWNNSKNKSKNISQYRCISANIRENKNINMLRKSKSLINTLNKNMINEKINNKYLIKNKNESSRKLNKNKSIILQNDISTNNKYNNNKYKYHYQSFEYY